LATSTPLATEAGANGGSNLLLPLAIAAVVLLGAGAVVILRRRG
jgi:hypothetical protein